MTDLIDREGSAPFDESRYVALDPSVSRLKTFTFNTKRPGPMNMVLAVLIACNAFLLMANVGQLTGWKAGVAVVVAWALIAGAVAVLVRSTTAVNGATAVGSVVAGGVWLVVNSGSGVATSIVAVGVSLAALAFVLSLVLVGAPAVGTSWSSSTLVLGSIIPVGGVIVTTAALFVAPVAGGSGNKSSGSSGLSASGSSGSSGIKIPAAAAAAEASSVVVPGEKSHAFQQILAGNDTEQAELAPTVPLSPKDQAIMTQQLTAAYQAAEKFPTVAAAKAAGMVLAGGMAPGVGAHYQVIGASDLTSLDGSFNPSEPASWIYASTANDAPIVGVMYESLTAQPPSGFIGPNDHWHRHSNLCVQFTPGKIAVPFAADQNVTPQECSDVHGVFMKKTVWMVHAWVIPGWQSPQGTFSHDNLHVYCPGNTDLVDAIGFCTRQQ